MALDCEITVPGADAGVRGNGAPARTKVGLLSSFLRDSSHYYMAVWRHVKECPSCDPAEVLRGFIANRDARQGGQTSSMLVGMAEKYRRHFRDRVPEELVQEFVVRCASSWGTFEERVARLSAKEIVRAHDMYMVAWKADVLKSGKKRGRAGRFARTWPFALAQGSVGWLNDKERSHLGRVVPEHVRKAAALSREEAVGKGGWDLMVWLITRHDRDTAMADPDVRYILAIDMAEEIMEA